MSESPRSSSAAYIPSEEPRVVISSARFQKRPTSSQALSNFDSDYDPLEPAGLEDWSEDPWTDRKKENESRYEEPFRTPKPELSSPSPSPENPETEELGVAEMSDHDGGPSEEVGAALVDSDNEELPSAQPTPVDETDDNFLYIKQAMLEAKHLEHLATKRTILPCVPGGLSRCFKIHVEPISYPGIRLMSEQVPVRLNQALQECQRQCNAVLVKLLRTAWHGLKVKYLQPKPNYRQTGAIKAANSWKKIQKSSTGLVVK